MVSGLEAVKKRKRKDEEESGASAGGGGGDANGAGVASFGLNVPKKATVLASPAVRVSP